MEKFQGYLFLFGSWEGSKSDGLKAYLVFNNKKAVLLYRPGIYEINDEYFFTFHKKFVEISGTIFPDKAIEVHEIEELPDPVDTYLEK
jgi:hypothetical protein